MPYCSWGRSSKDICWMTNIYARDFWFSLRNCSFFIIISGHDNLSQNQTCTGNRRDRAAFLAGVDKDLKNMERLVRIAENGNINKGCELYFTYNSPEDCTSESTLHHFSRLSAYCKAQKQASCPLLLWSRRANTRCLVFQKISTCSSANIWWIEGLWFWGLYGYYGLHHRDCIKCKSMPQ